MVEKNNDEILEKESGSRIRSNPGSFLYNFYFGKDDGKSVLININKPVQFSRVLSESKNSILNNMLGKYPIERILSKASILIEDNVNFFSKYPEIYFQPETGFFGDDWEKIKNNVEGKRLYAWYEYSKPFFDNYERLVKEKNLEENMSLGKGIIKGATLGFLVGGVSDYGKLNSASVEGTVRFVSGNGDTIFSSIPRIYNNIKASIQRFREDQNLDKSSAIISDKECQSSDDSLEQNLTHQDKENKLKTDIYAVCAFLGMFIGPILHFVSNVLPTSSPLMSALYSSGYSNSDNLSGTMGVLIYNIKTKGMIEGVKQTLSDPFHASNLTVIIFLFVLNFTILSFGFVADTQTLAALHGTLLNVDSLLVVAALYIYHLGILKDLISQTTNTKNLQEIINSIK